MERPDPTVYLRWFVILSVIMPVVFFSSYQYSLNKKKAFLENGKKVSCEVDVVYGFIGVCSAGISYPKNEEEVVRANIMLYDTVKRGDTLVGYVMSDDPYNVFVPGKSEPKHISALSVALSALLGIFLPILYIRASNEYEFLLENGKDVNAELMSYDRYGANTLYGNFRFEDENGKKRSVKLYISKNIAELYETYNIRYYTYPNGEIKGATADERLNMPDVD